MFKETHRTRGGEIIVYCFSDHKREQVNRLNEEDTRRSNKATIADRTFSFLPPNFPRFVYFSMDENFFPKIQFLSRRGEYKVDWQGSGATVLKDREGDFIEPLWVFGLTEELFVEYMMNFNDETLNIGAP